MDWNRGGKGVIVGTLGGDQTKPGAHDDTDEPTWSRRAPKRTATQNRSFPLLATLIDSVEATLAHFAIHSERVNARFGRSLDRLPHHGGTVKPAYVRQVMAMTAGEDDTDGTEQTQGGTDSDA